MVNWCESILKVDNRNDIFEYHDMYGQNVNWVPVNIDSRVYY